MILLCGLVTNKVLASKCFSIHKTHFHSSSSLSLSLSLSLRKLTNFWFQAKSSHLNNNKAETQWSVISSLSLTLCLFLDKFWIYLSWKLHSKHVQKILVFSLSFSSSDISRCFFLSVSSIIWGTIWILWSWNCMLALYGSFGWEWNKEDRK